MSAVEIEFVGREELVIVGVVDELPVGVAVVVEEASRRRWGGVSWEEEGSEREVSMETRWVGVSEVLESWRLMGANLKEGSLEGTLALAGMLGVWKLKFEVEG